jgi:hypothetical protein
MKLAFRREQAFEAASTVRVAVSNGRKGRVSETRPDLRVAESPEGESSRALSG